MQPGALAYLADVFEARAPGLAVLLRDWEIVLPHDPLDVAKAVLAALASALRLAEHDPLDKVHLETIEVLDVVFQAAARAVFARAAAGRIS